MEKKNVVYIGNVYLNDDVVDKIMEKMLERGFKNIEWCGDRGGEWISGVSRDFNGENLKISIDLEIEVEEVEEEFF